MRRTKWMVILSVLLVGLFLTPAFAGDITSATRLGWGLRIGRVQGNLVSTIAGILGLNPTKVLEQRHSGRSLVEIAEAQGVDKEQLVQKILEERKRILDQMVKEGRITQEQADLCLKNMKQRVEYSINRTSVGPPPWAGKGFDNGSGNGQARIKENGLGQGRIGHGFGLGNGGNSR
ncbi:Protein of unknown function [Thermanaeromonas toyohensis ToBE]|uniref:DUF2680 domain-containing protein n=1 Tax=Thermanaeromonas toyohensis ToBE TaxID=698762 RepID=A0A1W1W232_9FIRM|nr:DUF2680 domain-containing protein [Thermanaeromonas toyohensis]SMB99667.1 Protein of unknown function [Thermanaeromonas toyohensis ToBE]